ncbi:MAG TPA: C40 family peptidase [Salinimicrobium sp.]|nr:C40 family peptidase [Salinimicrobium sp.]
MKKNSFWNIAKFFIAALVIILVVYLVRDKSEVSMMDNVLPKKETTIAPVAQNPTLRDSIVTYSTELLGTPYVTAGSGRDGFDCSGFVYFVYQNFDINVPRSTSSYENFGTEIPIEAVQKGDLILFLSPTRNEIGHIGIVTKANGKNSDFIHATSGRAMRVVVTNLSNKGYTRRFVKAIRVL